MALTWPWIACTWHAGPSPLLRMLAHLCEANEDREEASSAGRPSVVPVGSPMADPEVSGFLGAAAEDGSVMF